MNSNAETVTREQLQALVQAFYRDLGADETLAPIFVNVLGPDWRLHLERIVEFWCTALLGSRSYRGNMFDKHMRIKGVRPEHFARWLALWQQHTASRFGPAEAAELQRMARRIALQLFRGFFGDLHGFPANEASAAAVFTNDTQLLAP
jgi:hemoglobin